MHLEVPAVQCPICRNGVKLPAFYAGVMELDGSILAKHFCPWCMRVIGQRGSLGQMKIRVVGIVQHLSPGGTEWWADDLTEVEDD